jgi:hypothetical protein
MFVVNSEVFYWHITLKVTKSLLVVHCQIVQNSTIFTGILVIIFCVQNLITDVCIDVGD